MESGKWREERKKEKGTEESGKLKEFRITEKIIENDLLFLNPGTVAAAIHLLIFVISEDRLDDPALKMIYGQQLF